MLSLVLGVNRGRGSSLGSVSAEVLVGLADGREGVIVAQVHHIEELLLLLDLTEHVLPRFPALHDSDQLELVVCCIDQLLDHACSDLVLNGSDGAGLINDLHSEASKLLAEEFVAFNK